MRNELLPGLEAGDAVAVVVTSRPVSMVCQCEVYASRCKGCKSFAAVDRSVVNSAEGRDKRERVAFITRKGRNC